MDGFDSEEIYIDPEDETRIIFDNFTKYIDLYDSEIEFDSVEVDIRYEAEEDEEELLRRAVEQTNEVAPNALILTPNPIDEYVMISLSSPMILAEERYELQIFDRQGKLVSTLDNITLSPKENMYTQKANLSHLPSGIYYLSASSASRILVVKFIKT
ncbi:MAG: T9SS type A sorting domain-containing protein [Bacteroidia bacterium]|nr:T9SS type A sorting domain-containing protein [Bacteroidia bacterium]